MKHSAVTVHSRIAHSLRDYGPMQIAPNGLSSSCYTAQYATCARYRFGASTPEIYSGMIFPDLLYSLSVMQTKYSQSRAVSAVIVLIQLLFAVPCLP